MSNYQELNRISREIRLSATLLAQCESEPEELIRLAERLVDLTKERQLVVERTMFQATMEGIYNDVHR